MLTGREERKRGKEEERGRGERKRREEEERGRGERKRDPQRRDFQSRHKNRLGSTFT